MKRIVPVLGTSLLVAFALGAQAEQRLSVGQLDGVSAGSSGGWEQYQDPGKPLQDPGKPCQEGSSCDGAGGGYLPMFIGGGDSGDSIGKHLDPPCKGGDKCTRPAPEPPVCQNDDSKQGGGKHHHGKHHHGKHHGGKHHFGKHRHGGKFKVMKMAKVK